MNIPNQIPRGEMPCLRYIGQDDKVTYVVTASKQMGKYQEEYVYKLYKVDGEQLIYTKHKAKSPLELEQYTKE